MSFSKPDTAGCKFKGKIEVTTFPAPFTVFACRYILNTLCQSIERFKIEPGIHLLWQRSIIPNLPKQ